jgi:ketopantoate reductase
VGYPDDRPVHRRLGAEGGDHFAVDVVDLAAPLVQSWRTVEVASGRTKRSTRVSRRSSEAAEIREPFDLVHLVTKAYDARWHSELIKPVLPPDGLAVGLQNGMTLDDMAEVLGPERTFASAIEIAGNCFEPGVIERQTPPAGTWFALDSYDEHSSGDRVEELAEPLRSAGAVEPTDDPRSRSSVASTCSSTTPASPRPSTSWK